MDTGAVFGGNITSISVGGSVEAGTGSASGYIRAGGNLGNTVITGDLVGNANDVYSGRIYSYNGTANVTVGSMTYAHLTSFSGLGNVTVYGDIKGGYINAEHVNIGTVTISGSLIGTSSGGGGRIYSHGAIGAISIAGSVLGGNLASSGQIYAGGFITSVDMGGNVVPAPAAAAARS